MQRRRRAEDGDVGEGDQVQAEAEALRQLETELAEQERLEDLPPIVDEDDLENSVTDPKEVMLATPRRPTGMPEEVRPLFTEEQISALGAAQLQAPHLYGGALRLQGLEEALPLPRPAFLVDEEKKTPLKENVPPGGAGGVAALGDGSLGGGFAAGR